LAPAWIHSPFDTLTYKNTSRYSRWTIPRPKLSNGSGSPKWDSPHRPTCTSFAADLAQKSLATALGRSPYAPHVPAFFGWLGVTGYLGRAAIHATWRAIRQVAASGSHLVFDYFDVDAFDPEQAATRVRFMLARVRDYGEPLVSGLEPHTLEAELAHRGFRLVEHLHPDAIEALYFQGRTDGYHATEHKHFAWAMVEEPRSP
jgi:O-methyltransferase involved in polyketide biosynthesis